MIPKMLLSLFFALVTTLAQGADVQKPLGRYGVDPAKATVSGLSSGGYMAVQLGVAYSGLFSGVGVVAAGPYGCAYTAAGGAASLTRALGPCMAGGFTWLQKWQCWTFLATCPGKDGPDADASIALAREAEKKGAIDSLSNVAKQRIFIVSGKKDSTVHSNVVDTLERFYATLAPKQNVRRDVLDDAAHTFPTDTFDKGNRCSVAQPPFISDCHYDAAKAVLAQVYGPLMPRNDGPPAGTLIEFDQRAFFPPKSDPVMADTGYAYVPKRCSDAPGCAVHVALHGCKQSAADVDKAFMIGAGYNRWADTNAIVILYPQVRKATLGSSNPENCWDWWGYTGAGWYEKRSAQMSTIVAMVRELSRSK